MSHVLRSSLVRIMRYEDLSIGQIIYIKSRTTKLHYKCKITSLDERYAADLRIKLTDEEYIRYRRDGAIGGQDWGRQFAHSQLYLNNDPNDISFWKGK